MAAKSELLARVARLEISTPNTWVGDHQTAAGVAWQGDAIYYCRTEGPGEKVTIVAAGRALVDRLRAAAAGETHWAIQTLYDFEVGGAFLLTNDEIYFEGVWGSPMGLLRQGLVAHRQDASEWRQEFQLRFFGSDLREMPIPDTVDLADLIHVRIGPMMKRLKDSGLRGLFEWGSTAEVALVLDWKPMNESQIHELQRVLLRAPDPDLPADFERPALGLVPSPLVGPVVFDHGARLSHVVTRAAEAGPCDIQFRH